MDIIVLGWSCLTGFVLLFGFALLYLYRKDHDTHKLMFALGVIPGALTFFIYALDSQKIPIPDVLSNRLMLWGGVPLIICIFFILMSQIFFKKKDFKLIFGGFLFFFILSFILFASGIVTNNIFSITMQIGTIAIIVFSLVLLIRDRNLSSALFILAMICFVLGGITLREFREFPLTGTLFSPLFCYFMSYIFLALIVSMTLSKGETKGIETYFSLKNKLQTIETKLDATEKRYQMIIENTRDAIVITRRDGLTAYVSPSYESMFGYKSEELVGQKKWNVHPDDVESVEKNFSLDKQKKSPMSFQYRIQTKSGDTKWVSHLSKPVIDEHGVEMIVSAIRDITDMKSLEKEMIEKVNLLEGSERATLNIMDDFQEAVNRLEKTKAEITKKNQELQTKTEDLTIMNQELNIVREQLASLNQDLEQRIRNRTEDIEKLLKQKDEFIGQLGHDLKTPLTPLNTLLPIIKKREQDPKLVELLDATIQNVNYMKNLVVKTLQLARLNSSNIILAPTDFSLSVEIKHSLESMQSTLQETGIIVESNLDDSIIVNADVLHIKELIDNLFSNAAKYTPPGGKITVTTVKEQDSVITSIQDTGVGLTVEQLEHLFEEFYKADPSRHDLQSTGLGLAICKRIVEKHGGKIWAESSGLGKGAAFHFTMKISDNKLIKPQKDNILDTRDGIKE